MSNTQNECLSVAFAKSLSDFVNIVTELNGTDLRGALYRGQSSTDYEITSTLHRALTRNNPTKIERARNGFLIFQKERHLYHDIGALSNWDELCLAQHYGLPTRLLDWTLDPLTAMYFALESVDVRNVSSDACVYLLPAESGMPWAVSKDLVGEPFGQVSKGNNASDQIILIPDYLNSRVRNQSGVFTLSREIINVFPKAKLHQVVVAAEDIPLFKNQLIQFGISRKKIYMDVESLCTDLKDYHY